VRIALARLSTAGALVALAVGGWHTWSDLGSAHAHLSATQAANAAATREHLSVALFDSLRARLTPGQRWWLGVPAGAPEGFGTRGNVYRAYAVFSLLPSLPASSEADADVVFSLGAAQ